MQILLVRLRLIGDVVFTTPAIRALRRHFPDARLTYLVEEAAAPVVRGNPHLHEVIAVARGRDLPAGILAPTEAEKEKPAAWTAGLWGRS